MLKITSAVLLVLMVMGCSTRQKTSSHQTQGQEQELGKMPDISQEEAPIFTEKRYPKLGIVLGPGGARSQAYIGFLRELEKAQIPVHAISGIEWGSMVAALYSQKGKSNEVEWQLSKLDSDFFEKGLLSSSTKEFKDLRSYLHTIFGGTKIEEAKVSFVCPGTRATDGYSGIFYRGTFVDTMAYCLPFYPLLKPANSWYAGVFDLKAIHEYFKKQGVEYVILIDVASENPPQRSRQLSEESKVLWSLVLKAIKSSEVMYNKVIKINVSSELNDFKSRKSQILSGEQQGKKFIQEYKDALGI